MVDSPSWAKEFPVKKLFFLLLIVLALAVPLAAQALPLVPDMGVTDLLPAAVIGAAIACTSLFKVYVAKIISQDFVDKFIWLPSIIVGVIGALLLTNPLTWRMVVWNAFCWAAGAAFIVLIVKRLGDKKPAEPGNTGSGA
jgi:hypothetical protein